LSKVTLNGNAKKCEEKEGNESCMPNFLLPQIKRGVSMFIRNCITNVDELITVKENDSIDSALQLLNTNGLKSVPVIKEDGSYVGILSKEKCFEILEANSTISLESLKKLSVSEATDIISPLNLDSRFEETFPLIVRYPFVPIVGENNQFVGIVKRKEITTALESSFGVNISGLRLLIGTAELEGRLEKILEITHQLHLNVITAVAFDAGERLNRRVLLKVKQNNQKEELIHRLEKHGFSILTIHED